MSSAILAIDPGTAESGMFIGTLCRRSHRYGGEAASLRYRSGACVECQGENAKARRALRGKEMDKKRMEWSRKNPEKVSGYLSKYRSSNKESIAQKMNEYRRANLPMYAEKMREYRKSNMDIFRSYEAKRVRPPGYRNSFNQYLREWAKANPDKKREHAARRAGRKLGRLEQGSVTKIGRLQTWKCACCRVHLKRTGYHIDHIMPLALGGEHAAFNIQLLCPKCNLSKSAKHPVDFMRQRGYLL